MLCLPPVRSVPNRDSTLIKVTTEILSSINSTRTGIIHRDSLDSNNKYQWNLPKLSLACNMDIFFSRSIENSHAISIGFAGTFINKQFYGMYRLGYALEINKDPLGFRFDIGFAFLDLYSIRFPWGDADGMSQQEYHDLYFDPSNRQFSTELNTGCYISFTTGLHLPESDWRFNIQCAWSGHSISGNTDLIPRENEEPTTGISYVSITPFISYDLTKCSRLLCGLRMVSEIDISNTNGTFILLPFCQYEFNF